MTVLSKEGQRKWSASVLQEINTIESVTEQLKGPFLFSA